LTLAGKGNIITGVVWRNGSTKEFTLSIKGIIMERNLSEQVFYKVHQDIEAGILKPGQKLPPERELESKYNVSRITINRAMTKLKALGFIDRRQGSGTFVTQKITAKTSQHEGLSKTLVKFISPGGAKKGDVYIRSGVVEGMHDVLNSIGIDVTINFYYSTEEYVSQLSKFDRPDSYGLVVWYCPCAEGDALLLKMKEKNYPFVLVDHYNPEIECDHVVTDNIDGAEQMVNYLAEKGHRRIVYITDERKYTSLDDRQTGFIKAMLSHKLPISNSSVLSVDVRNLDAIEHLVRSIIERPDRPTAIFVGNDLLAFDVYGALKKMGLRVPDDISLAGYDNVDNGQFFEVPLTTVAQDFYKMGQLAGTLLEELNEQETHQYYHQLKVKASLVERRSVGMIAQ
jgi:DNA-binding LacI/PurR family transcriptional regulator